MADIERIFKMIRWYGHASVGIHHPELGAIYIDPFGMPSDAEKADFILVTHSHYDHFSPTDIEKLQKDDTILITTKDCTGITIKSHEVVEPGESYEISGLKFETVPGYNMHKKFHPKANGWVGYILDIEGARIYHPGDTDYVPEMNEITANIAFFPVGGTYTMDAEEAAEAANAISPQIAVPMHYGNIIGSDDDAQEFKRQAKVPVTILKAGGK